MALPLNIPCYTLKLTTEVSNRCHSTSAVSSHENLERKHARPLDRSTSAPEVAM
jgi:hypothetical protein